MGSVNFGTIASVPTSSANFCTKHLPLVTIKNNAVILHPAGFFTGSLAQQKEAISTGKKTSLPSSQQINQEEDNKKGTEKVENKKSNKNEYSWFKCGRPLK